MKKTPRGKHQTMMNKLMMSLLYIVGYFLSTAFVIFMVILGVHFHKTALGIYNIERDIQQIHQRLDEKSPVDKNDLQNVAEIG